MTIVYEPSQADMNILPLTMNPSESYIISQPDDNESLFQLVGHDYTLDGVLQCSLFRSDSDDFNQLILNDHLDQKENSASEWTHLLIAGPLVINYVNSLLVYASKRDFPFIRPSNINILHIQDINSFRETISQISDVAYSTLLNIHIAMLRVQFNVQHLSSYIRTAVELLISNSSTFTEFMLPKILADINRISNESVTYTRTTVDKLSYLPDLLSESLIQNFLNIIKDSNSDNFHFDLLDRELILILLIEVGKDIEQEADLLYTMFTAYSDTSSKYIVNQINSINLLILQTNDKQSSYLSELSFNTTLMSARVDQLAQDQQNQYIIRRENRHAEYEQLLAQID
ncbi:unnamed protein product [Rotaria sp. Silwood2]|nr:unnamed protein product [Rotaria sp. Silwood2]